MRDTVSKSNMTRSRRSIESAVENFICATLDFISECLAYLVEMMERAKQQRRSRDEVPVQERGLDDLEWMSGEAVPDPASVIRGGPPVLLPARTVTRFYAVAVGRNPGIYETWSEAAQQVNGYGGNVHRAFTNRREAEFFMEQNRPSPAAQQYRSRVGIEKFCMLCA